MTFELPYETKNGKLRKVGVMMDNDTKRAIEVNVDIVKTLTNGTKIIAHCWEGQVITGNVSVITGQA